MASPPSLTLLMPRPRGSPLRLKPTETSPPTNSPPCRRQYIPSPLETTPPPSTALAPPPLPPLTSQHQTQPSPQVHRQHQFDLTWIYTVLFLRSRNQPRSDLSTATPHPTHIPPEHTPIPPSKSASHPPTRHPLLPSPPPTTSAITLFSRIQRLDWFISLVGCCFNGKLICCGSRC